jgi:hypothetical protein
MPIDPNIPLSAVTRMPQAQSPLAMLGDVLQIQGMQARNRGYEQENQQRHELAEALRLFRQFAQQNPGDWEGALVEVAKQGYADQALVIAEQLGQARRADFMALRSQLDTESATLEQATQLYQGVTDQAGHDQFRAHVMQRAPDIGALIPEQYTPEVGGRIRALGMKAADWNRTQKEAMDRVLSGDWQGGIGWALSKSENPQLYAGVLELGRKMGAPKEILALFPPEWTPEAQAIAYDIAVKPRYDSSDDTPTAGSFEDFVTRAAGEQGKKVEDLTTDDIAKLREKYRLDDRQGGGGENAVERLDDDAVEMAATAYRLLGSKSIPTRISGADRSRIMNAAARQAKALGDKPVVTIQKQAAYQADSKALANIRKIASGAQAFEYKALQQLEIVRELSNKVDRTQFPIINDYLLRGQAHIFGDKNTQLFYNAVLTFTTEYAKIMSGSTNSAAASTDSARREAAELISTNLNKGTIDATLDLMRREMELTMRGYDVTEQHIRERMLDRGERDTGGGGGEGEGATISVSGTTVTVRSGTSSKTYTFPSPAKAEAFAAEAKRRLGIQ